MTNKLTLRTFAVTLHGTRKSTVEFIGPEFTEQAVRKFLIEVCHEDKYIVVKLIREVVK